MRSPASALVDRWLGATVGTLHEETCHIAASERRPLPSLRAIAIAEICAAGHTDYARRWSSALERIIEGK